MVLPSLTCLNCQGKAQRQVLLPAELSLYLSSLCMDHNPCELICCLMFGVTLLHLRDPMKRQCRGLIETWIFLMRDVILQR